MRRFSFASILSLLLLAGCATAPPPPAQFGDVPGPSKTTAVLSREAMAKLEQPANRNPPQAEKSQTARWAKQKLVPAAQPKPTAVEKQKRAPTEKSKAAPAAKEKSAPKPKGKPATSPAPELVTPDASLSGRVTRYNSTGRFVVLEFPIAHLPGVGQRLFVYRNGLKTGEIEVTGPQRDDHTVADVKAGEAQPGDEVREQ